MDHVGWVAFRLALKVIVVVGLFEGVVGWLAALRLALKVIVGLLYLLYVIGCWILLFERKWWAACWGLPGGGCLLGAACWAAFRCFRVAEFTVRAAHHPALCSALACAGTFFHLCGSYGYPDYFLYFCKIEETRNE